MKFLLIFLLAIGGAANADTVQWSKGYTADCDSPTERVDGTALPASEISHIIYQIIPASGGTPTYEALMQGGCKPTFVDTKSNVPTGDYLLHGITVDTDGQVSVQSSPGVPMTVQKAKPKPPTGLR